MCVYYGLTDLISAKKWLIAGIIYRHLFAEICLNCKNILDCHGEWMILAKHFLQWYHSDLKGPCPKCLRDQENGCVRIIH